MAIKIFAILTNGNGVPFLGKGLPLDGHVYPAGSHRIALATRNWQTVSLTRERQYPGNGNTRCLCPFNLSQHNLSQHNLLPAATAGMPRGIREATDQKREPALISKG
ncbi:MAG: hypothetical protein VX768_11010 [Planctomycetota bacterium]|nr:hypothetical protein [Planctomycetota bacterium]